MPDLDPDKINILVLLAVVFAVLIPLNKRQKEENRKKKRNESLMKDYPEMVSRLLLLLYSGVSVRTAFFKMGAQYAEAKKFGCARSETFEEVIVTCRQMESGKGEEEAYEDMAKRCALPAYRSLSVLLMQNHKRGGKGFTDALEREAYAALAAKRREAEAAGAKASVKLMIPLGIMLIVVLALMMIPAFMSL